MNIKLVNEPTNIIGLRLEDLLDVVPDLIAKHGAGATVYSFQDQTGKHHENMAFLQFLIQEEAKSA